jgi:UDP-glucose:glycoprotein glucosyltransferase
VRCVILRHVARSQCLTRVGGRPVKFWLLKNYISPEAKALLPAMAEELGCEYELVQYKWPLWLKRQTVKQRTIWG